jgi:hypothetical protein
MVNFADLMVVLAVNSMAYWDSSVAHFSILSEDSLFSSISRRGRCGDCG